MSAPRPPGRPRDEAVTRAILDAAITILSTSGFDAMSIEAVARQAGVSRPSVYSRWPNLGTLVLDATVESLERSRRDNARHVSFPVPDTGSLAGDLSALVEQGVALFLDLEKAGVIQALLVEAIRSQALARRFQETFLVSDEAALGAIFQRAVQRGEWPVPRTDGPDPDAVLVLRSLIAHAVFERYVLHQPFDASGTARLAGILAAGSNPAP